MGWKKKSAQKVNFGETGDPGGRKVAKGEALVGKIVGVEETTMDGHPHNYTMEDENGDLLTFLGTAALDRLIKDEEGSLVKLTYLGDVKSGGGFNVKQFDVEIWDDSEPEKETAKAKGKK